MFFVAVYADLAGAGGLNGIEVFLVPARNAVRHALYYVSPARCAGSSLTFAKCMAYRVAGGAGEYSEFITATKQRPGRVAKLGILRRLRRSPQSGRGTRSKMSNLAARELVPKWCTEIGGVNQLNTGS